MTVRRSVRFALAVFLMSVSVARADAQSSAPRSGGRSAVGRQHPHERRQQPTDAPMPAPPAAEPAEQGRHEHAAHDQPSHELPPFITPLTPEDRTAAFPDVEGHTVHDQAVHYFALFDQLEWQAADRGSGMNLDSRGWAGRDRDRLWFRAEGESAGGRLGDAHAHVLYGRQVSRWWDIVAGIRQDGRPGPAQTWAAVGVQGLAPYWFEIEATAYVGASGRTQARFEVEYELLLTNRLIVQPLVEAEIVGKSDPERGVGAGLSTTDAGFRLRYELRRELAPYIGVAWRKKWGKTADFADSAGEETGGARFVTGMRLWF
jgi:copper resistance protein B